MAGNVKLMTSAGGGVVLDTATTTATDVTVKVPVTGVNNGTLVCSDSSGNVGIGTSSPAQALEVVRTSTPTINITETSGSGTTKLAFLGATTAERGALSVNFATAEMRLATGSSGNTYFQTFYTNGAERMRIDSNGNLLVGTTSLIQGSEKAAINFSSNIGPGLVLSDSTIQNGATFAGFFASTTRIGAIVSNGTTNVAYNTSSDYRLKENIQPMQNALSVVAQLNPVTYTWKADGSDGQGFIAHELQAVVPDCVTGEKDAVDADGKPVYQGVDTSFLVGILTKAIQELKAELDATKAEVAALKAK